MHRWGEGWLGVAARGLAGHQLASGEQLHCPSLVLYILMVYYYYCHFITLIIIIIFFLFCPIKHLHLNSQVLPFFFLLSPILLDGGRV